MRKGSPIRASRSGTSRIGIPSGRSDGSSSSSDSMGEDTGGPAAARGLFGEESFIRATDTTGAPVLEDDRFAGLR